MEQIIAPHNNVLRILQKPKLSPSRYRLFTYAIPLQTDDGTLLLNLLTRELVLLSDKEHDEMLDNDYLRQHWFVVPEELNDMEYADLVRWVLPNLERRTKHTTGYSILTTTDCNARCFYCFEKGCERISMTADMARRVAAYIRENSGGEKVSLLWFGGEPLVNYTVIDIICEELCENGIEYSSSMISNGYLLDDELISRAVANWKLKQVQITLDGTESLYNRSKAYIYGTGSPYQVVLQNIERLLDANIVVNIRLNIGLHNADDLMLLVDELVIRFNGRNGMSVYGNLLYEIENENDLRYSKSQRLRMYEKKTKLDRKLIACGLSSVGASGLSRRLRTSHCMADSGSAVVIAPDGHLRLCNEFAENEYIGHVNSRELDQGMVNSWKERWEPFELCKDCVYYPECIALKKCPNKGFCSEFKKQNYRFKTEQGMLEELKRWKTGITASTNEENDGC